MSVGKRRDRRQLELSVNKTFNHRKTIMKTNTHTAINLTTTPPNAQATNPAQPQYDRILLGVDQHAEHLRIVRQLDGAGPQPPQRVYPGGDLERFIQKQLAQAKAVFAVYEAGPCGFVLARQLKSWGVTCFVIRPMKLDPLGKRVNTDKTDAAELVSRLDRFLAGNRKAFAVVRVPTPVRRVPRCLGCARGRGATGAGADRTRSIGCNPASPARRCCRTQRWTLPLPTSSSSATSGKVKPSSRCKRTARSFSATELRRCSCGSW